MWSEKKWAQGGSDRAGHAEFNLSLYLIFFDLPANQNTLLVETVPHETDMKKHRKAVKSTGFAIRQMQVHISSLQLTTCDLGHITDL